jgi:putative transposase
MPKALIFGFQLLAGFWRPAAMTRPYSMDLRDRAVTRVLVGESVRYVAATLSISAATVVRWSQRYRLTGSEAPGKVGGHKPNLLSGSQRDWLLERTATDFTLGGLVTKLADRGVKVDYVQVWRFAHAEGLSFKKCAARRTTPTHNRKAASAVEEVSGTTRSRAAGFYR